MADYPSSITNQKTTFSDTTPHDGELIAKGLNGPNAEINAIETELGTSPKAAALATRASTAATVAALLGQFKQGFKDVLGTTNWYDAVPKSLTQLLAYFNGTTGHAHTGGTNDGPQIDSTGIKNGAVSQAKIVDGDVSTQKLADSSVTTAKIAAANVTAAKIDTNLRDGWIDPQETWTYASATTITIPAGGTSKYSVGDRIRIKQGGSFKYLNVVVVANTLLTVTGGSDYTVANASITNNYYSHEASPQGFPQWFNYDCNPSGWSGTPTQTVKMFNIVGSLCTININVTGTSNATTAVIHAPVTCADIASGDFLGVIPFGQDNTAVITNVGTFAIRANSTTIDCYLSPGGAGFTSSGTKQVQFVGQYRIGT